MIYSLFPQLRPSPISFKILDLPDVAFAEILKFLSLPALISLTLTSRRARQKVARNMGPVTRSLLIVVFPGPLLKIVIRDMHMEERVAVRFVSSQQPKMSKLRDFLFGQHNFGSEGLPVQYSGTEWTVFCDSDEQGLDIVLDVFFGSPAFRWTMAHFEAPIWLTTDRLLSLRHCQWVEVRNGNIANDDLNKFLRHWQEVDASVRRVEFQRAKTGDQPFDFDRIIDGLVTKPLDISMEASDKAKGTFGEYVIIQSTSPQRTAILYKQDDSIVLTTYLKN